MKSLIRILLLIAISTRLYSQELTKEVFLGTWKVVDSQFMPEMEMGLDAEGQKTLEQIKAGFIGTIFNFEENNDFTVKFPDNIPEFMSELEFIDNKKWEIVKGQKIAIGSNKDNYSLMGISVLIRQEKKYFIIDESPYVLEVVEL